MTFGPVVSGSRLSEDEVVGTEEGSVFAGLDGVQDSGLQIYKNGPGHVLASLNLVVVNVDLLQKNVIVSDEGSVSSDLMF